tara:strand:- start:122 stop:1282 length:1161 start_codon:yes stop_codon:yes gene_type:complete
MSNKKIDINKKYNLPEKVIFCKKCVISNQRPKIVFDEEGVCSACRYFEYKKTIDFKQRENELIELCNKYRSSDHSYDCVVPSSGGKDSATVAHQLKHIYGMNPLTVTWSPLKYTQIGWENLTKFNESGFDVILGMGKGDVSKRLCKEALIEMGDPFQGFIYGQVLFPLSIAIKYGIKLVFRGENAQAEYGGLRKQWDKKSLSLKEFNEVYFSKYDVDFWLSKGFTKKDLAFYLPVSEEEINKFETESFFYGYFKDWSNHSNFYYASENTGFKPNIRRTEGTYTKYSSIDDKIDPFHHYFSLLKFGHGRCTANAAREVREGYITREEAVALVHRYDEEFPNLYFDEFLDYCEMTKEEYYKIEDKWRNSKIWAKEGNKWKKKFPVFDI